MTELPGWEGTLFLLGLTVVAALLIRVLLRGVGLPAVVGYLMLGFLLRFSDEHLPLLSKESTEAYHFLAKFGLFALLFKVGLTSNLVGLLRQLKRASVVWTGDVIVSGALGFLAAHLLLGLDLIPSVMVGTALTATSVGVSVAVWQNADVLGTAEGQLLTDVAELDDMTGVALMALVFSSVTALHSGSDQGLFPIIGSALGTVAFKLVAVLGICLVFSRYLERRTTRALFRRFDSPGPVLGVMGIGMLISAMAALLGLSLAIGAFLAGLAFSRDPQEHQLESSFEGLHQFLSPFFFIGIGLNVDPNVAAGALSWGIPLLLAAMLGKFIGVFLSASLTTSKSGALLLGISMIPRAEIALVIVQRGRDLGDWAIPADAFAAMVVVSAGTCALAPLILHPLLNRWRSRLSQS